MTVAELIRRLRIVAEMDLPEQAQNPWLYGREAAYWYHPKEWAEGYQAHARDMLRTIDREGLKL